MDKHLLLLMVGLSRRAHRAHGDKESDGEGHEEDREVDELLGLVLLARDRDGILGGRETLFKRGHVVVGKCCSTETSGLTLK